VGHWVTLHVPHLSVVTLFSCHFAYLTTLAMPTSHLGFQAVEAKAKKEAEKAKAKAKKDAEKEKSSSKKSKKDSEKDDGDKKASKKAKKEEEQDVPVTSELVDSDSKGAAKDLNEDGDKEVSHIAECGKPFDSPLLA
jgi:hypothetical protein